MRTIRFSVGRSGANRFDDVTTIQQLLNLVPVSKGGPTPPFFNFGTCGADTINAIMRFQLKHIPQSADGRVNPGGQTLGLLNTYDTAPGGHLSPPASPSASSNPTPEQLTKVRQVLAISYGLLRNPNFDRVCPGKRPQLEEGVRNLESSLKQHGYSGTVGPQTAGNVGVLIAVLEGLNILEGLFIALVVIPWLIVQVGFLLNLYKAMAIALLQTAAQAIDKIRDEVKKLEQQIGNQHKCKNLFPSFYAATTNVIGALSQYASGSPAGALMAWLNAYLRLIGCLGLQGFQLLLKLSSSNLTIGGNLIDFIFSIIDPAKKPALP